MDLKQNTDFILGKIDSLMTGAMPFLEKGAEEIIRYKVIEFRASYLVSSISTLIFLFVGVLFLINGIKNGNKVEWVDAFEWILPLILGIISSFLSFLFLTMNTIANAHKLILSFTSPEMFAIMELLRK